MTQHSTLSSRLAVIIRQQRLFTPSDTLIIGLSGGADSTALLDLLATLPAFPLRLVAVHLNHCLRGAESDADEEFCRQLAQRYAIPFESRRVDVKVLADKQSLNLEDAGRRTRIAFFDELRITWQATAVVLAQHADDQAETVLMRLLRGSGMTGLAGMSWQNGRGYVRPLLGFTRTEIESHLVGRALPWRDDASNQDRTFLRNRIRHELLPLLEQYNPAIRGNLAATAAILAEENELLEEITAQACGEICSSTPVSISCSIESLTRRSLPLQRRIIRQILSRLAGNLEQFSHCHIEDILRLNASQRPNARINLPQGIVVRKEYDALVFSTDADFSLETMEVSIPGPGIFTLPGGRELIIEMSPLAADYRDACPGTAWFDLDKTPFPWYVRTFKPGDRIRPLGMSGIKKVKDIFIDCKVPLWQRHRVPLIFSGEELIWVSGLRMSETAKVDNQSKSIVRVRVHIQPISPVDITASSDIINCSLEAAVP